MGIPAAELTALQTAMNSIMDLSIQVKRRTPTADGFGGFTEVWNNVGSAVNGTLAQPTGGLMQNYGYAIGDLNAWLICLPIGTSVLENDRVVGAGRTMRVEVILAPESYQLCVRLLASAVDTEAE